MTYQGDATALSGENEICDDCQAAAKLNDQRAEFGLWPELEPALKAAQERSRIAWSVHGIKSALGAMHDAGEARNAWRTALAAAEETDFYGALEELEHARSIAAKWGDDSNEREALRIVGQMKSHAEGDEFGWWDQDAIGLEGECPKCIAICLDEEEHYDALASDHDAQR